MARYEAPVLASRTRARIENVVTDELVAGRPRRKGFALTNAFVAKPVQSRKRGWR